jgi:hypothetical protein
MSTLSDVTMLFGQRAGDLEKAREVPGRCAECGEVADRGGSPKCTVQYRIS